MTEVGSAQGALPAAHFDEHLRSHNWSTSALGPPVGWPPSLQRAIDLVAPSGFPGFVLWGPSRLLVYNAAYAPILGPRHPSALGRPFFEVWPEVEETSGPVIAAAYCGHASFFEDLEVTLLRSGKPERTWFTFSYSPIWEESEICGAYCVCIETTEKVVSRRAAETARTRQTQMFRQAPGFICLLTGPEHVFEFVNEAYVRLFSDRQYIGRSVRACFPELAGQGFFKALDEVYRTGERFVASGMPARLDLGRPQERQLVLDFIYEPLRDEEGKVTGIFCEGFDVTDVHQSAKALHEHEEQLRLATEAAEIGLWDVDPINRTLFWPPRVKAMFGISADQPVSMDDFYGGLHPADRERVSAAYAAACDPNDRLVYDVEYRTVGKEDGRLRWVAAKGRGLFDADGICTRVIGTAIDISARKRTEEHLLLMVNELNHRVKNSLAIAQAVTTGTLRDFGAAGEIASVIAARLVALSKATDVLTDSHWEGADLTALVDLAAEPYGGFGGRFHGGGPAIALPPRAALALALAFHELATNAAKYGALSSTLGSVHLSWEVQARNEENDLHLRWRECDGPAVAVPARSGFGSRLIRKALETEVGGDVRINYEPTGLICEMRASFQRQAEAILSLSDQGLT